MRKSPSLTSMRMGMTLVRKVPDFCHKIRIFADKFLCRRLSVWGQASEEGSTYENEQSILYHTSSDSISDITLCAEKSREFLFERQRQEQKPQEGRSNEIAACRETSRRSQAAKGHVMIFHPCNIAAQTRLCILEFAACGSGPPVTSGFLPA
jgi:hypothetical protein